MDTIRIWFTDFWDGFDQNNNYLINQLRKIYLVELDKNDPQILFFSFIGCNYYNYKKCIRIFFTGENIRPDYSICDYSISFDYDTHNGRNLRLPLYVMYDDVNKLLQKKDADLIFSEKTKFCNFIYSNNNARFRQTFFSELSKYKKIDSGGKVLNNLGYYVDNKIDFLKSYKFTIAFENISFPGYNTEKIFEPMLVNSLPIYWGNPQIKTDFNVESFINVHDYGSIKEVVDQVIDLDNDDVLYKKMLSQPYMVNNQLNKYVEESHYLNFMKKIIETNFLLRRSTICHQENPFFSIIIPVYNVEKYLTDCFESILKQSFTNFEIICVNDGSSDQSDTIIQEYKNRFQNFTYYYQDNQGLSVARNKGLSLAKGEYILFVDSDDMLLEEGLINIYNKILLTEVDVLHFGCECSDHSILAKSSLNEVKVYSGVEFFKLYQSDHSFFPPSSVCLYVFKNSFLKDNNLLFTPNIFHEDEDFFLRMIILCKRVSYMNNDIYFYRIHRDGSIMNSNLIKRNLDLMYIARSIYYYFLYNRVHELVFYYKIIKMYHIAIDELFSVLDNTSNISEYLSDNDLDILEKLIFNYSCFRYYYTLKYNKNIAIKVLKNYSKKSYFNKIYTGNMMIRYYLLRNNNKKNKIKYETI